MRVAGAISTSDYKHKLVINSKGELGLSSSGSVSDPGYLLPSMSGDVTTQLQFTKLPKSTVVPTNDSHFTNKKYVDDAVAKAIEDSIIEVLGGEY